MPFGDRVPFLKAASAAGCGAVLSDEDRVVAHRGLLAVIRWIGGGEPFSELLVRAVVGFGCDVTAQVFQLFKGEQHRKAGERGSDGIGNLVVDLDGVFEDELPLSQGQPEPELLVLIDALLPHDITPKHSIRFSLVEPVGSNNRLSCLTSNQTSSFWLRSGSWIEARLSDCG